MNQPTRRLAAKSMRLQVSLLVQAGRTAAQATGILNGAMDRIISRMPDQVSRGYIDASARLWQAAIDKVFGVVEFGIRNSIILSRDSILKDVGAEVLKIGGGGRRPPILPGLVTSEPDDDGVPLIPKIELDPERMRKLIYSTAWEQRLSAVTKLAGPDKLARVLADGFAQGKSIKQMQRDLEPIVGNVRSSAKRIARHESMWAATRMQNETYNQLGNMVAGFQVHAVLDDRTRPEHRKRNGTIYWKEPKGNQKGIDEMPHPPYEADGSIAHNCRCFMSPVLAIGAAPVPAGTPPIDPGAASAWFNKASRQEKIEAIGAERYHLVTSQLGREPQWSDLIQPDGAILGLGDLRRRFAA